MSGLTAEELARQAGTTPEQIERFVELGILEGPGGGAAFGERDIHRVRFAEAIDAAGISLDDLARLVAEGEYSFTFIEDVFPGSGWPLVDMTFGELAASLDRTGRPSSRCTRTGASPRPTPSIACGRTTS